MTSDLSWPARHPGLGVESAQEPMTYRVRGHGAEGRVGPWAYESPFFAHALHVADVLVADGWAAAHIYEVGWDEPIHVVRPAPSG